MWDQNKQRLHSQEYACSLFHYLPHIAAWPLIRIGICPDHNDKLKMVDYFRAITFAMEMTLQELHGFTDKVGQSAHKAVVALAGNGYWSHHEPLFHLTMPTAGIRLSFLQSFEKMVRETLTFLSTPKTWHRNREPARRVFQRMLEKLQFLVCALDMTEPDFRLREEDEAKEYERSGLWQTPIFCRAIINVGGEALKMLTNQPTEAGFLAVKKARDEAYLLGDDSTGYDGQWGPNNPGDVDELDITLLKLARALNKPNAETEYPPKPYEDTSLTPHILSASE